MTAIKRWSISEDWRCRSDELVNRFGCIKTGSETKEK